MITAIDGALGCQPSIPDSEPGFVSKLGPEGGEPTAGRETGRGVAGGKVGVGVGVWVAVAVGVAVGTGDGVAVAVAVRVGVGVAVWVAVAVGDEVEVAVGSRVGVFVGSTVATVWARAISLRVIGTTC